MRHNNLHSNADHLVSIQRIRQSKAEGEGRGIGTGI